jgi:hypothetical protein
MNETRETHNTVNETDTEKGLTDHELNRRPNETGGNYGSTNLQKKHGTATKGLA